MCLLFHLKISKTSINSWYSSITVGSYIIFIPVFLILKYKSPHYWTPNVNFLPNFHNQTFLSKILIYWYQINYFWVRESIFNCTFYWNYNSVKPIDFNSSIVVPLIINLRYLFPYIIIPKHFLIPIFHDSSNLLFPHITSPKKLLFQIFLSLYCK
jgi:hypothetical protein